MNFIKAIKIEEPSMGSGNKFFLIKLLYVLGDATFLPGDIRTISKALGLNDRMVSKALDFLLNEELLERKYISRKGKGRASSEIHVGEKLTSALRKVDCDATDNSLTSFIELLLGSGKGSKADDKNGGGLGVSSRVLLLTLLAYSDEMGVVDSLGQGRLGRIAGLKKEALIKQVEGLLAKGFIRRYVPGFTRENLFGKAKGIYILNLRHKFYQNKAMSGTTLIYLSQFHRRQGLLNESELLHQEAKSKFGFSKPLRIRLYETPSKKSGQTGGIDIQHREINLRHCWDDIRPFFTPPASKASIEYFQVKLELLVSDLLSNYWAELGADEFPETSKQLLLAAVNRYFIPEKFVDEGHQGFPLKEQLSHFRSAIFDLALNIANSIRETLIATGQFFDAQRYHFLVVPTSRLASETYGTGIVLLEIFPKNHEAGECKCGVLIAGDNFTINWGLEEGLGILPYQVGLMTYVKQKTAGTGSVAPTSQTIESTLRALKLLE